MNSKFRLKVPEVYVFTNLETRLNSRTTKEQAMKEVERLCDGRIPFEDYEWKIEGCANGGILEFGDNLKQAIIERIEEDPEECVDWDGMNAGYELNLYHVLVLTNLELPLAAQTSKEDAVAEVQRLIDEGRLFQDNGWKIEDCDDGGINQVDQDLQEAVMKKLGRGGALPDCIEEVSG